LSYSLLQIIFTFYQYAEKGKGSRRDDRQRLNVLLCFCSIEQLGPGSAGVSPNAIYFLILLRGLLLPRSGGMNLARPFKAGN
jgi:hypothetical protein